MPFEVLVEVVLLLDVIVESLLDVNVVLLLDDDWLEVNYCTVPAHAFDGLWMC